MCKQCRKPLTSQDLQKLKAIFGRRGRGSRKNPKMYQDFSKPGRTGRQERITDNKVGQPDADPLLLIDNFDQEISPDQIPLQLLEPEFGVEDIIILSSGKGILGNRDEFGSQSQGDDYDYENLQPNFGIDETSIRQRPQITQEPIDSEDEALDVPSQPGSQDKVRINFEDPEFSQNGETNVRFPVSTNGEQPQTVDEPTQQTLPTEEESVTKGVDKPGPIIISSIPLTNDSKNGVIDFSQAERNDEGLLCITKDMPVEQIVKESYLECVHGEREECHYSYLTIFEASPEEECEENFEKVCHISFEKKAMKSIREKCYTPLSKSCNGDGPEVCNVHYETSCTTVYEHNGNKNDTLPKTSCQKNPIRLCGKGCTVKAEEEVCHQQEFDVLRDVPVEHCDLSPRRICKTVSRLLPKLKPEHKCSKVPTENCNYKYGPPKKVIKPQISIWCLDKSTEKTDSKVDGENANNS